MERSVSSTPSSPDALILQIYALVMNLVLRVTEFPYSECSLKIAHEYKFKPYLYFIGQALDLLVSVS